MKRRGKSDRKLEAAWLRTQEEREAMRKAVKRPKPAISIDTIVDNIDWSAVAKAFELEFPEEIKKPSKANYAEHGPPTANHPYYGHVKCWEDVRKLLRFEIEGSDKSEEPFPLEPDEVLVADVVYHHDNVFRYVVIFRVDYCYYITKNRVCQCTGMCKGNVLPPFKAYVDEKASAAEVSNTVRMFSESEYRASYPGIQLDKWSPLVMARLSEPIKLHEPPIMDTWRSKLWVDANAGKTGEWRSNFPTADLWRQHFSESFDAFGVREILNSGKELSEKVSNNELSS